MTRNRQWFLQLCLLALFCAACWRSADALPLKRIPRFRPVSHVKARQQLKQNLNADLINQCQERWREAPLDHFTWGAGDLDQTTYKQRYFVCNRFWKPDADGNAGPIFFYLGNEADVTLYLNASGLMWESAPDFGALLVFAEHRYYGESVPFGRDVVRQHMQFLGTEQAMADYAELLADIKQEHNATAAPVIGFGGSYGGMLAAWMRMKYPHVLDGAVAASAPIWNFLGEHPEFDPLSFSKGVTHDASEAGGSPAACVGNVRKAWGVLMDMGSTDEGRAVLAGVLRLCNGSVPQSDDDMAALREWLAAAWDYMAMGNFPYPSGYILNGHGSLPAYPVRVACSRGLQQESLDGVDLIAALGAAASVYYNASGDATCYDWNAGANPDSDLDEDFWGYQYCTEMFMPFAKDGVSDMFWAEPWDEAAVVAGCQETWGVTPRRLWATTEWGGKKIGAASRIAFSNGLLDPWHGGGVLQPVNDQLPAIIIPEGAHHLDLMFSNPSDPQSVKDARSTQRDLITQWIKLAREEASVTPSPQQSEDGMTLSLLQRAESVMPGQLESELEDAMPRQHSAVKHHSISVVGGRHNAEHGVDRENGAGRSRSSSRLAAGGSSSSSSSSSGVGSHSMNAAMRRRRFRARRH